MEVGDMLQNRVGGGWVLKEQRKRKVKACIY